MMYWKLIMCFMTYLLICNWWNGETRVGSNKLFWCLGCIIQINVVVLSLYSIFLVRLLLIDRLEEAYLVLSSLLLKCFNLRGLIYYLSYDFMITNILYHSSQLVIIVYICLVNNLYTKK